MPVTTPAATRRFAFRRLRISEDHGFTMVIAVGVMALTALLLAAGFVAINGDVQLGQHDLDGKRAYYAARAGENAYLYQLNQNPDYWKTCANDTQSPAVTVPGSVAGETYAYSALPANGNTGCTSDPVASLIDAPTGTLRVKFVGYSGTGASQVSRTLVASFRRDSPLDYLWYTVYEALDASISGASDCATFYRNGRDPNCNISWAGDTINGPMYTQDQYLIYSNPTFGRNASDKIKSVASAICSAGCGSASVLGTAVTNAPTISPPSDNSQLLADAVKHGQTFSGTTSVVLSGTTATVTSCPSSCLPPSTVDLTRYPIIYVSNAAQCTPYAYSPYNATYPTSGCTGDVYVSGSYTTSVTLAAANNIIVNGNLTTTEDGQGHPSGTASLGLVANYFVRVEHGVSSDRSSSRGQCGSNANISNQTLPNPTKIDAAILTLQHSFIVDNYDCGGGLGTLTVNGAIAQYFRGAVGTSAGTGYAKNYNYDDRLSVILPPYLFDIATSGWHIQRETLCDPTTC